MDRWGRLAWHAQRQHGVVHVAQARALGISFDALSDRAREQRWRRPYRGVYVLPGHPEGRETALMAGLLFLGPGAAVARRSAAPLWGLSDEAEHPAEFIVDHARRPGRASGLIVLRSRTLEARDLTALGALRVTTVDRTLCDLAAFLDEATLCEAVARAVQRDTRALGRVQERADRMQALPGAARLAAALAAVEGRTDSTLERRVRRVLRQAGLRPASGVWPVRDGGRLVAQLDIAFPRERVAVEVDGFAFHATPSQMRADHLRQNRLHALGWVVLRVGAGELADGGARLTRQVRAALALRSAEQGVGGNTRAKDEMSRSD
jgi:very-short-patch-repair endonuclease